MNSDESFEREVRETLNKLAGEPAPDRLVASVAAIPNEEAAGRPSAGWARPGFRSVVSGFAAIAAVVVLAVAAIVLRPGAAPPIGDAPSGIVATPSAPASTLPQASPTIESTPSAAAPTTEPSASVPPLAGGPVPAGFRPMSVTFVSTDEGWVLGSAQCAVGRCPAIAHTLDGGRTWSTIPAPATTIGDGPTVDVSGAGISGLRFADPLDGWAFGPQLWSTHDGGSTWKQVALPAHAAVVALGSGRGTVHAVEYDGEQAYRIASAPVDGDGWTVSAVSIPVGAGPVPVIQLVLSGGGGWVLENDRTVVAGARLVDGTWRTWDPPCSDVVGPAYIAASSAADLVAACDVGLWSSPEGGHLFVSHDGGGTFSAAGPRIPFLIAPAVATPGTKTIVLAGLESRVSVLEASFDGGRTWTSVSSAIDAEFSDLGFTSSSQGVVIATRTSGSSRLLMTRDGGHTWSEVTF